MTDFNTRYIDLGLPFLVADRNIGAETPDDYGMFFSDQLLDCTRKARWDPYVIHYKAEGRRSLGGSPMVVMRPMSDVLQSVGLHLLNIPTEEQMKTLLGNSKWRFDIFRKGYYLVSRINGAEVFFPAAGYYADASHQVMCWRQKDYEQCKYSGTERDVRLMDDESMMHGGLRPVPCGRYLVRKTCNNLAALGWTGGTRVLQMYMSDVKIVTMPGTIWMPVRTVLCK
jgi:hypothetical protein